MKSFAIVSSFFLIPALLQLTGCASVPVRHGFDGVKLMVLDRQGEDVAWKVGDKEEAAAKKEVNDILSHPLTADAAVRVAFLNSPTLQAELEELGIARADVIAAGLIDNPTFSARVRFPDKAPKGTNLEFTVAQDLMGLLMLSARKNLASQQFQETQIRVADEVLGTAEEVRKAFYNCQAAEQMLGMQRTITQAAEASFELAGRQYKAGDISELGLATEKTFREQSALDLLRAGGDATQAHDQLSRLLGMEHDSGWTIRKGLPDIPGDRISSGSLESMAVSHRLDLAATRQDVRVLSDALAMKRKWRWVPFVNVEVSTERDTTGQYVTGPTLEFAVPLFNRNQASLARLAAQKRQDEDRLAELTVKARSEVRQDFRRLALQRAVAGRYKKIILPLRAQIISLSLREYNYMLIDPYQLLAVRKNQIEAYREYVKAVQGYWIARTELERALGWRLAAVPKTAPSERPSKGHSRTGVDRSNPAPARSH